jgi:hypothetical protein
MVTVLDSSGKPVMVLGRKYYGLHPFRHFFASPCINRERDGGLEPPPKMVQQRLGHSTIAMTWISAAICFPAPVMANPWRALNNHSSARHKRNMCPS